MSTEAHVTRVRYYILNLLSIPSHIRLDPSPGEMMLCKIFQKQKPQSQHHSQPPPQGSRPHPASRWSDPAYPSSSMSRTAQWVAQQAQQEYQLVQRRTAQSCQTRQTSTVQGSRAAYRRAHDAQAPRSRRPQAPLMDLSSLEGPPIEDTRLVNTAQSSIPHIREEPATPNGTPPNLLWKPLPLRPSSADPLSPRQQRRAPTTNLHTEPLQPHTNLRRVPAQRTRQINPEDEDLPDQHPPSNERSRSPTQQNERPHLRSHSSGSLLWLEDEEQWVVTHVSSSRSAQPVTRLPTRLRNATTRPIRRNTANDLDVSDDELERLELPPDYESHRFSPTYIQRYTYGPASRLTANSRRAY